MLYLLDANVIHKANQEHYPIDRIPEYWDWLVHLGNQGTVKIPWQIYEEIKPSALDLKFQQWSQSNDVKSALILNEEVDPELVDRVFNTGYANDLNEVEIDKIGMDPFLIAHALKDVKNRCVVTGEVSKPSCKRGDRRIPDVCNSLGVTWYSPHQFIIRADFRTNWKEFL